MMKPVSRSKALLVSIMNILSLSELVLKQRPTLLVRAFRHSTYQHHHHHHQHHRLMRQHYRCLESIRLFSSFSTEALGEAKREFQQALNLYESNLDATPSNIDQILSDLETEASDPDFWEASNSARNSLVTSQISQYSRLVSRLQEWKSQKEDCEVALDMLLEEEDGLFSNEEKASLLQELQENSQNLLQDNERYQLELLLSGPYDDAPCRILLTAGAGGTEANDWVSDLKRMYERHASKMGYTCKTEDSQTGEVVGYKSVELVIEGLNPYGWFKGEKGAHRLVRLSPFNANNKRQTTFAGVDVAPIFVDDIAFNDIEIPDKDLEITTMRSGGAGGQVSIFN
jgi:peptide chain release factor 2